MKKAFAILMSLVLMLSLAVPAMAADEDGNTPAAPATYSITINNTLSGHTYEAYQIFKGDLSSQANLDEVDGTSAVLSNIQWGSGVNQNGLIAALKAGVTIMSDLANDATAADVAEKLSGENYNSDAAKQFAKVISQHLSSVKTESVENTTTVDEKVVTQNYTISLLDAGYYLVKDKDASLTGDYDAYTSYIIEVVENSTVNPKSKFPSVDKQVQDEVADKDTNSTDNKDGWGETADHAINETFQFKLIATLPADADFAAYETYKVVFTDKMSDGITFESIESVYVNTTEVQLDDNNATTKPNGYTYTATAGQEGGSWMLTIADITEYDSNLADGATITVIYKAHLNEKAKIGNVDENKNTVFLEYSNNPNVEGGNELGKTPEDTVWVFTYAVNSTKYKNEINENNKLDGAGFTLYYSADGTTKGNAVKLIFDNGDKVYRPAPADATEGVVTEMTSANGGVFNVVGLDVGTYIMEETNVPAGYNKCDDIVIEITAAHAENETSAATNIEMKIDKTVANINNVVNKAGSTLPETGGMGTTIFYIVGGVMVAAAVVLLITKKRMSAEG